MENLNILGVDIGFGGKVETARNYIENLVKANYQVIYFDGDFLDVTTTEKELKEVAKIISDTPLIPFSAHNLQNFLKIQKNQKI